MGARLTGLLGLPGRISALDGEARARADRLLDVRIVTGRTDPPPPLEPALTVPEPSVSVPFQVTVAVLDAAIGAASFVTLGPG